MAHRILSREGNGRFRQSSLERDFGIRVAICSCGGCNPYTRVEQTGAFVDPATFNKWDRPEVCSHCGAELPKE